MKILIRNFNNTFYVWKDATWHGSGYHVDDDFYGSVSIAPSEVVAVKDDNRNGYVVCKHCGELILNNPEAIEKHYADMEAKRDCAKCKKARIYGDRMNETIEYVANDDGTYRRTEECTVRLGCTAGYYTKEVHSADAKRNCIYNQCRQKGVSAINDIFVKYPGVFDKCLTVDFLKSKKYVNEEYVNGYFEYDLKLRGTLKACVNKLGIVDHFRLNYNGWNYYLYYSEKYEKLFYADWGIYKEGIADVTSNAKAQQVLTKISKLYKEAETNE